MDILRFENNHRKRLKRLEKEEEKKFPTYAEICRLRKKKKGRRHDYCRWKNIWRRNLQSTSMF